MQFLSHPNSTTLPWWHGENFTVPFTFCWGSYSSETLLGSIYMGYFGKNCFDIFPWLLIFVHSKAASDIQAVYLVIHDPK